MKNWIIASKLNSILKVILPLLAGLSYGYYYTGRVVFSHLIIITFLFAWAIQSYIVFLNDYADARADTIHTERFPELIGRRVIPEGLIEKDTLLIAGIISAIISLSLAIMLTNFFQRPYALALVSGSLLILWAYSFPPFKLNYRGFGELLETFGIGFMLPVIGFYIYSGTSPENLLPVLPVVFFSFALALAGGIKHEPADRITGKNTFAVMFGPLACKNAVIVSTFIAIALNVYLVFSGTFLKSALLLTVIVPLYFLYQAISEIKSAGTEDLPSLKTFKSSLHYAFYSTLLGISVNFYMMPY